MFFYLRFVFMVALMLFCVDQAFAQAVAVVPTSTATTASTTISTGPLVDQIFAIIQDLGPVVLAAIAAWIGKNVKNENARKALVAGVDLAAKGAYSALVAHKADISNIPVKNAAIATMANDVIAIYPKAMKTFGLTPDAIHTMIDKSLGGLLAADPNVTVTGTATTPVTPPPIVATVAPLVDATGTPVNATPIVS